MIVDLKKHAAPIGGVGVLAMTLVFGAGWFVGRGPATPAVAPTPDPIVAASTAPPPAGSVAAPSASTKGVAQAVTIDAKTWTDALAKAAPKDVRDTLDHGSMAFAAWARDRLAFSDVLVTEDETTFARVLKDSDAERGRRMCVGATIVQIRASKAIGGAERVYEGVMMTGARNYLAFYAVGSTGELVERRHARFCGVVTGRDSYPNTGGGWTHGVRIVGMFDLPENRKRVPPAAAKSDGRGGTVVDLESL